MGSVTVSLGWGGAGLASAGAEAVSVDALGWQPVMEKTVRATLNAVKVVWSLFTAADLTAGRVTGKAGKILTPAWPSV
ncbi:MAG: hypothetical protein MKZ85_05465 [Pedosphaera sp.]|nr:hypothetical protein [Pedosphaera sp.]